MLLWWKWNSTPFSSGKTTFRMEAVLHRTKKTEGSSLVCLEPWKQEGGNSQPTVPPVRGTWAWETDVHLLGWWSWAYLHLLVGDSSQDNAHIWKSVSQFPAATSSWFSLWTGLNTPLLGKMGVVDAMRTPSRKETHPLLGWQSITDSGLGYWNWGFAALSITALGPFLQLLQICIQQPLNLHEYIVSINLHAFIASSSSKVLSWNTVWWSCICLVV